MENNNEKQINEQEPNEVKNENQKTMSEIEEKNKYFESAKNSYEKIFAQEFIENVKIVESCQQVLDKKMDYLRLSKELYNNKKPELNSILQLKKKTKERIYEEISENNKEYDDDYFHIDMEAYNYCNNNKNNIYKSYGLKKIS